MMTKPSKVYHIQGIKLTLKPLTVGQFKAFAQLSEKLSMHEEMSLSELVKQVIDQHLSDLMEIIFAGQNTAQIDWLAMEFEQLDEVIEDFLSLNPRLRRRLRQLLFDLVPKQENLTDS